MAYFIRAMRARKLHFVLQLSPSIGIRRYCHDQNYPFRLNGYHHKTVSMHRNAVSNKSNIRHVQNHHRRQFLWAFSCYSPVHWSAVCVCVKKKETPQFVLFHYWLIADDIEPLPHGLLAISNNAHLPLPYTIQYSYTIYGHLYCCTRLIMAHPMLGHAIVLSSCSHSPHMALHREQKIHEQKNHRTQQIDDINTFFLLNYFITL